jgi:hypothetical protein
MSEKSIQTVKVISSPNKDNLLLPVDQKTLRQLSFAEPIKKSNILSPADEESILIPTKSKTNNRFCAVILWLTLLMLIFLIFQAALYAILFSECR